MIQCYTGEEALAANLDDLKGFLLRLGSEARQGAVGLVIDRDYLEIRFELAESKQQPDQQAQEKT